MVVRVIQAKEDKVTMADLIADLKKSTKIDYSGAIFTFEGIVRGKEENMNLEKLILTTPDKEKTQKEIEKIVENAKIKYNVFEISVIHYIGEFYTGDMLFLVAVLGNHRGETLDALKEVIETVKYDVEFKKEEISKEGTKTILAGGWILLNLLFIIKVVLLIIIIYSILKHLKTLLKIAVVLLAIFILLGIWGL